jgi:predicted RNA-binding protein with EMAP domain
MRKDYRRRVEITDKIYNKMTRHIDSLGLKRFCKEVGMSKQSVYKYLNRTQKNMLIGRYRKLQDYFNKSQLVSQEDMIELIKENQDLKKQIETHLDYNNKLLEVSSQLNEIAVTLNWITYRKINKETK